MNRNLKIKHPMKRSITRHLSLLSLLLPLFLISCTGNGFENLKPEIEEAVEAGSFSRADSLLDEASAMSRLSAEQRFWIEVEQSTLDRIRIDFDKTEEEVRSWLSAYYPELTDSQMQDWESTGALEMKWIDGEKRYFSLAARNLFRIDPGARQIWQRHHPPTPSASALFNLDHAARVIAASTDGSPVLRERFDIDYVLKVKANVVPPGEALRCWLPFPREAAPRQDGITLHTVNDTTFILAPPETMQRSLYLEKPAVANEASLFTCSFSYYSAAQWFDPRTLRRDPYNRESDLYREHTRERPPQVVFSDKVKRLADSLAGDETDPYLLVRAFYYWINDNIPWASALEYSIIDCIPDYVLTYRHGDCGMQTFLFMSLCRYKGIPVKWQSGWHVHPGNKNLHDWCEVYYEGTGWVPVDVSFGLMDAEDPLVREFYITGIDAYRLIVNDDYSTPFHPSKRFYRSEPYDFQRGEVEWKGGNLYFDQWTYSMKIGYEKEY